MPDQVKPRPKKTPENRQGQRLDGQTAGQRRSFITITPVLYS